MCNDVRGSTNITIYDTKKWKLPNNLHKYVPVKEKDIRIKGG